MLRTSFWTLIAVSALTAGCNSQGASVTATSGGSTSALATTSAGGSTGGTSGSSTAAASTGTGGNSTSSGGKTTSGSTSGGNTSGSTGGTTGCLPTPDGGPSPYTGANCVDDSTCCGLTCVFARGAGTCEPPCLTTADCPLPYTVCQQGECTIALCGGSGQAAFNARCDLADAGDGTCVSPAGEGLVQTDGGGFLGNCMQGGTAITGAPCDGNALRDSASQLCVAGDVCTYLTVNAQCFQSCDLSLADAGCPTGTTCQPYSEASDAFTACL